MAHSIYSDGERIADALKSASESLRARADGLVGAARRCGDAIYAVAARTANIDATLDRIARMLARQARSTPLLEAQVCVRLAEAHIEHGELRDGWPYLQRAEKLLHQWQAATPDAAATPALRHADEALRRPQMTSRTSEGLAEVIAALMFVHEALEGGDGSRTMEQFDPVPPECLDDLDLCAEFLRQCFADEFAKLPTTDPEEGESA